jgi:hypothetical protein
VEVQDQVDHLEVVVVPGTSGSAGSVELMEHLGQVEGRDIVEHQGSSGGKWNIREYQDWVDHQEVQVKGTSGPGWKVQGSGTLKGEIRTHGREHCGWWLMEHQGSSGSAGSSGLTGSSEHQDLAEAQDPVEVLV